MNTDTRFAKTQQEEPATKSTFFTCHLKKESAETDFVDDILQVNEEAMGGANILLSSAQLKEVLANQSDAITLYLDYSASITEGNQESGHETDDKEHDEPEPILKGYSILLGLNAEGVESFKAGETRTIDHISPSEHLSDSLDTAEAVYIVMIHGFDIRAQVEISMDVFDTISKASDTALAQEGTSLGEVTMERFGFQYLYGSPVIKFCELRTQQFTEGMNNKMQFLNMIRKNSSTVPEEDHHH